MTKRKIIDCEKNLVNAGYEAGALSQVETIRELRQKIKDMNIEMALLKDQNNKLYNEGFAMSAKLC